MKKPRELDCKKLCESYETCTLTHCGRKKGYRNGGPITMLSEIFSISWTKAYNNRRYREMADITDNGNNHRKIRV